MRKGFTLIELLVVIAIVAVLAVTVILTLNPAQLLRQARDSNRLSDLRTLNEAIAVLQADQKTFSLGTSSIVYVSLPDTSSTCGNLGLPAISGSYRCVTTSTLRNVDGTGWLPVNLTSISAGSPIPRLPLDPSNTSSTGEYYTYQTDGIGWELTGKLTSAKYASGGSDDVAARDGGNSSALFEIGNSLSFAIGVPASCKDILTSSPGSASGSYTIQPSTTQAAFTAYCDMTTDGGGWTVVTAQNSTSQERLTSNTETAGNPLVYAAYNTSLQKKMDLSAVSSETLVKRSAGSVWIKTNHALFDANLTTANQHPHWSVTVTANNGTTSSGVQGYANANNSGGGDYGIVNASGFDHHNPTVYWHLNGGCSSHFFYNYGTTYNAAIVLGSWPVTYGCGSNTTDMGGWYAAMR